MGLTIENVKKIRPLQDRILVERINEDNNITSGGIVIPDIAKDKATIGIVISAGPGKYLQNGNIQVITIKTGDKVFFGKYAGTEVSEDFVILREDEVLGILN